MKKRLLAFLLVLCLAFSLFPAPARAAEPASGTCGDNLTWRLEDNTLCIEGEGEMYDYSTENPAPWYGMDVYYLDIGPGVTSIGSFAFYECYDLSSGDLYDTNITRIGSMAFARTGWDGDGLTTVYLPKGLTEISNGLFLEAYDLEHVYIPDSVTSIDDSAFTWSNVESLIVPDSVTEVGDCAFDSIPGPVYFTGDAPAFVPAISEKEDGSIAFGSFGYYGGSVYYPADNASWNPDALAEEYFEKMVLPEPIGGPCDLGEGLYASWNYDYETKTITISGTDWAYPGEWDHLMNRAEHVVYDDGITAVVGGFVNGLMPNKTLRSVSIPASATFMEGSSFINCTALTDVSIAEGMTRIGGYAFSGCTALESITLPGTVTAIGNGAFSDCISLKTVNIPDGNEIISPWLFENCVSLETIELPATITGIGAEAFAGCTRLKEVYFVGDAPEITEQVIDLGDHVNDSSSFVGVKATCYYPVNNETWTAEVRKDYGGELTWVEYDPNAPATSGTWGDNLFWVFNADTGTLTISGEGNMSPYYLVDGTDGYPWAAFKSSISVVVLEEGVTSVSEDAFNGYLNLTEVSLPSTLTAIGWSGFRETGLVRVDIPDSVTSLGVNAFAFCEQMEYVKLPAGLESTGELVFVGCTRLSEVIMPQMPNLEFFAQGFMDDCDSLTNLDFVTSPFIGSHMFDSCSGLVEITLPETVTGVGSYAFYGCENLRTVTIPENVRELGTAVFYLCDNLNTIWFQGNAPANADENGFLLGTTATAYYPAENDTWTEEVRASYDGNITWVPYVENPFTDVPGDSFYYSPVLWAVENGITNGLTETTFGPTTTCNRAQVVTFLWRANGSPEPTTTEHSFVDVAEGAFYYKAMLWAVENGITNGTDATHFSPNAACNRATVVTFLWRAQGKPGPASSENPFTDVVEGSFYETAVFWAVENGITNGLTKTTFGPTTACNRGQVVTFLYRAYTE